MTLLDVEDLGTVLDRAQRSLFRIERLPAYDVPHAENDFERYLAGEAEPAAAIKKSWMEHLAQWAREGRPYSRVRIIHDPITDYERYACDWGYRLNEQAGELIKVIDLAELDPPDELEQAPGDWWLRDDDLVVQMHYREDFTFDHGEILGPEHVAAAVAAKKAAWRVAHNFGSWWAAHPQHHREARRV